MSTDNINTPAQALDGALNLSEKKGWSSLGLLQISNVLNAGDQYINRQSAVELVEVKRHNDERDNALMALRAAETEPNAQTVGEIGSATKALRTGQALALHLESVQGSAERIEGVMRTLDAAGAMTPALVQSIQHGIAANIGRNAASGHHYAPPLAKVMTIGGILHEAAMDSMHRNPATSSAWQPTELQTGFIGPLTARQSAARDAITVREAWRKADPLLTRELGILHKIGDLQPASNLVELAPRNEVATHVQVVKHGT